MLSATLLDDVSAFGGHRSLRHELCHIEIESLELVAQGRAMKVAKLIRPPQIRFGALFRGQLLETPHDDLAVLLAVLAI
jgi:hypothetical protein